ncbi:GSCFA domain-containing protein [Paracoccus sp. JM45]|uniref:GSCFA domain-containing protein n=1 Tax=Paracoccus sp. JM45 TaxID=2283626 RepID=UPI000E6C5CEF|nr:GSCFA domain-containing protein [Paracoccus sp. JM45]RJE81722.1 GSCFA family protein [Paracoccus sp. JM45]
MPAPNPYSKLPRHAYWRTSVARAAKSGGALTDVWQPKFGITRQDSILTTGSCFAQHISRALVSAGFAWHQAERAPFGLNETTAKKFGYGIFSFRTGNIYTTRMLTQLLAWAINPDSQDREVWEEDSAFFDPIRPQIEPGGFETVEELFMARAATLAAIRQGVEKSSVFVFTLGLTEGWVNSRTGLCYSSCPGTMGGQFDDSQHMFENLQYPDVLEDLEKIRDQLHLINPDIKMLLTVSPVPLAATAAPGQHVLPATMRSKSILHAAAGYFQSLHDDVDYFPSYEIVSHPGLNRQMFDDDRRSVLPEGVDFVMQHFLQGLGVDNAQNTAHAPEEDTRIRDAVSKAAHADDVVCEEIELEKYNEDRD